MVSLRGVCVPTDEAAGGALLAGTAAGRVRDRTSLMAPHTSSCLAGSFKFPFRVVLLAIFTPTVLSDVTGSLRSRSGPQNVTPGHVCTGWYGGIVAYGDGCAPTLVRGRIAATHPCNKGKRCVNSSDIGDYRATCLREE